MIQKLKDYLLKDAVGKVLTRLVASAAVGLASGQWGISLELSPEQQASLVTGAVGAANGLISWLKAKLPSKKK